ncbi:MAG: alkyl sulfatase dimerization domain-containing protein [Gammaproteobacteria bacterium]
MSPNSLRCALFLAAALWGCQPAEDAAPQPETTAPSAHAAIVAHSAEFERGVRRVTDNVYQAIGFGLANSMLVEGEDCAFVIDVMGSVEAAGAVQEAFRTVSDKPIKAFIYTHNHADHVFGGAGFDTDVELDVYAHKSTEYYIDRVVNILRPIIAKRSARMFGSDLPRRGPDAVINAGIGPFLEISATAGTVGLVRPTVTVDERLDQEICGIKVSLVHAPGETDDQLFVWLPDSKVLFPGDNIYKAFPNLYTIRGTPHRNVLDWVNSLDKMRRLGAEHLVPSHTRSVSGAEEIAQTLTAYRDGIAFVHDQTVRGINQGLTPDELVHTVQLPEHLARHPYLQELYGTVAWSVRAIFDGYLGWYSGDAAELDPASPIVRAQAMMDLAGGRDGLLKAAQDHAADGNLSLAAEFAGYLIWLDSGDNDARELRHRALRELATLSTSPNGRHYYLTAAMEATNEITVAGTSTLDDRVRALIYSIPIENFLAAMPTRLDPELSIDDNTLVAFKFTDTEQAYGLHVRYGVAQFMGYFPDDPALTVTTSTEVWRRIVIGERNLGVALAKGELSVEGGVPSLVEFLRLFR